MKKINVRRMLVGLLLVAALSACSISVEDRIAQAGALRVAEVLEQSQTYSGESIIVVGRLSISHTKMVCEGAPVSDPKASQPENCIVLFRRSSDPPGDYDGLDGKLLKLWGRYEDGYCKNVDAICTGNKWWLAEQTLTVTKFEVLE